MPRTTTDGPLTKETRPYHRAMVRAEDLFYRVNCETMEAAETPRALRRSYERIAALLPVINAAVLKVERLALKMRKRRYGRR